MSLLLKIRQRAQHPLPGKVLFACLLRTGVSASAQAPAVTATIDLSKQGTPITSNIYRPFLEHGRNIVNAGVWSEPLADRKFVYPATTAVPTPPPIFGNAAKNYRLQNIPTRWAPRGGEDVVTMDTTAPHTSHLSISNSNIPNSVAIHPGTHTRAAMDRFQNYVLPFFSKTLCFTAHCQ